MDSTSATAISLDLSIILYQSGFACNNAATIRIGNLLGAGHPRQARVVLRVLLFWSLFMSGISAVIISININKIGRLFTDDKRVLTLMQGFFPILVFWQILDSKLL